MLYRLATEPVRELVESAKMARVVELFKNLLAKNIREPKGIPGRIVLANLHKYNAVLVSKAVENLDIQPGNNVLEVGFGSGYGLTNALKKLEQGSGKVYGIDISEQVVHLAKKNFKSSIERQKLEIHLGSVMELPYSDNFFDRVFHVNCYYFWPDLDQGISELRRVMKTDSLMVSTLVRDRLNYNFQNGLFKYAPHWSPEVYIAKLAEGGFRNVSIETQKTKSGFAFQVIYASKS